MANSGLPTRAKIEDENNIDGGMNQPDTFFQGLGCFVLLY